jgi:hypothetical protein
MVAFNLGLHHRGARAPEVSACLGSGRKMKFYPIASPQAMRPVLNLICDILNSFAWRSLILGMPDLREV